MAARTVSRRVIASTPVDDADAVSAVPSSSLLLTVWSWNPSVPLRHCCCYWILLLASSMRQRRQRSRSRRKEAEHNRGGRGEWAVAAAGREEERAGRHGRGTKEGPRTEERVRIEECIRTRVGLRSGTKEQRTKGKRKYWGRIHTFERKKNWEITYSL